MSENESVMAVCAEWRDCIESADPSVWNEERIAELVKTTKAQQIAYLDRIEAAWKHESAEIEADALAVGGVVEAARHKPGNAAAMREALEYVIQWREDCISEEGADNVDDMMAIVQNALSAPPHKGKWENGTKYEYEYAYCSECGRMQWAGWDTHKQAKENIESFARDYKFCPGCGTEMEGGVYVK